MCLHDPRNHSGEVNVLECSGAQQFFADLCCGILHLVPLALPTRREAWTAIVVTSMQKGFLTALKNRLEQLQKSQMCKVVLL